ERFLGARDAAQPPARPAGETGHLEPERVAGQHRSTEARLFDRNQADVAPRDVTAELHERLAQHDAGQYEGAREVTREVWLVRADAPRPHRPPPRLHPPHTIQQSPPDTPR